MGLEPTTFGLEVQRAIHCATGAPERQKSLQTMLNGFARQPVPRCAGALCTPRLREGLRDFAISAPCAPCMLLSRCCQLPARTPTALRLGHPRFYRRRLPAQGNRSDSKGQDAAPNATSVCNFASDDSPTESITKLNVCAATCPAACCPPPWYCQP